MKQHITVEQLNELSEKGKERLRKWVEQREPESVFPIVIEFYPLSIGQMIQFLDEEYGAWRIESWQEWEIVNTENNKNLVLAKDTELCDALWQAVKEILES